MHGKFKVQHAFVAFAVTCMGFSGFHRVLSSWFPVLSGGPRSRSEGAKAKRSWISTFDCGSGVRDVVDDDLRTSSLSLSPQEVVFATHVHLERDLEHEDQISQPQFFSNPRAVFPKAPAVTRRR